MMAEAASKRYPEGLILGLVLVSAISIGLYHKTVHPSVAGGDSGELMCVAHELGTPHPPGYPTFAMLTKAAEVVIRAVDPSLSVGKAQNLFHATLSGFACALLYLATALVTKSAAAGVLAALMFGFSPNVWTYAVVTEVFALNNLFTGLLLLLVALFAQYKERDGRVPNAFVGLSAFCCGLALTNQHTSVLFVVPIVLWVFANDTGVLTNWKRLLSTSFCFFAGLTPYAYLPWSSSNVLTSNSWGQLNTVEGFLHHFLRKEYGTFSLASQEANYRVANFWRAWRFYVFDITEQTMTVVWILAAIALLATVYGWVNAAWRKIQQLGASTEAKNRAKSTKSTANTQQKGATLSEEACARNHHLRLSAMSLLLLTWFLYNNFFNYLSNLPIDQPLFYGVQQRFWLQPLLIVSLFMGAGFDLIVRKTKLPPIVALAIALAIGLTQVGLHYEKQNESDNYFVRDFGRVILGPLPKNAILLTKGDLMINSVRFVQCTEGFRPDVTILDQELLTFDWYNRIVKQKFPDIKFPGEFYFPGRPDTYTIKHFIDANRNPWKRRIFLAVGWKEADPSVEGNFVTLAYGLSTEVVTPQEREHLIRRVDGTRSKLDKTMRKRYIKELLTVFPDKENHRLPPLYKYPETSWEAVVLGDTQNGMVNAGYQLMTLGEDAPDIKPITDEGKKPIEYKALEGAVRYFQRAMADFEPEKTPSYVSRNLGVAIQKMLPYRPGNVTLIQMARDVFQQHIQDLKDERRRQGMRLKEEDYRSITDAVAFYDRELEEAKRAAGGM